MCEQTTELPRNPHSWRQDNNTYRYWQTDPDTKRDYCIWSRFDKVRRKWVCVIDHDGTYHLGISDNSADAFLQSLWNRDLAHARAEAEWKRYWETAPGC